MDSTAVFGCIQEYLQVLQRSSLSHLFFQPVLTILVIAVQQIASVFRISLARLCIQTTVNFSLNYTDNKGTKIKT
jgi:hypothetical protein